MNDRDIDDILGRAADASSEVDPALLRRISASMASSLQPVRPIAPSWLLALGLVLVSLAMAILSASLLGMHGLRKLGTVQIGSIFTVLGILALLVSITSVSAMTPGSKHWVSSFTLLAIGLAAWLAADALLFRDYQMGRFVPEGVRCLLAGLIVAAPTGVLCWLILRRGFAVNPASAGLAAGTLAGLAGLVMLELHCAIVLAPHIMTWHTAVVPISALVGMVVAQIPRK
jgi:hypothetical protein